MCDWIITKSFLKSGIANAFEVRMTCCGLETKMWMQKGIVNQHQRAVSRMTLVMSKVIMW
jgi:hypothetical protein